MIILALAIGALCLYTGYKWGYGNGQSHLERKIVRHVTQSQVYEDKIVDAIRKGLREIK